MAGGTIACVEGDTLPDITVTYTGADVSAYQSFRLHVYYPAALGGALIKNGTLVNGPAGIFKFTWSAGELKAGRWPAEIQLTDAVGKVITFRELFLDVAKQIA